MGTCEGRDGSFDWFSLVHSAYLLPPPWSGVPCTVQLIHIKPHRYLTVSTTSLRFGFIGVNERKTRWIYFDVSIACISALLPWMGEPHLFPISVLLKDTSGTRTHTLLSRNTRAWVRSTMTGHSEIITIPVITMYHISFWWGKGGGGKIDCD